MAGWYGWLVIGLLAGESSHLKRSAGRAGLAASSCTAHLSSSHINLSSRGDAQQQLGLRAIDEALCLQRAART